MTDHQEEAARHFTYLAETCIPYLSIDCLIFGFHEGQLKVLLLRWKGTDAWSLPGGFIRKAESVDDAAHRILQERTSLAQLYLQQFHVFGDAVRYNQEATWSRINTSINLDAWSARTISIGYYALVEYSQVMPTADFLSDACEWWRLDELPALLFDHNHIIDVAITALRQKLAYQPIHHLLPPTFTLSELQRLYETILDCSLDSRNFYKKIMATGILDRRAERRQGTPYKSPYLYQFSATGYAEALQKGILTFA